MSCSNEHKNGDNIQTLHKKNVMKLELVKNLQTKIEIKNIVKILRNHFKKMFAKTYQGLQKEILTKIYLFYNFFELTIEFQK
jgi:hypothetical protein